MIAPPATAHVTVVPVFVEENVPTRVELDVPNERRYAMTGLRLDVPAEVEIVRADAPAGWLVSSDARAATWNGGVVGFEQSLRFPVTFRARGPAGTTRLVAVQRYSDGATVRWTPSLTVLPATGEAAPQSHLTRALVAAGLGVVLVAASLVVVRRLRRGLRS